MLFNFHIEGNLAAQPELRFTDAGVPVAQMRVLYNGRYRNNAGEWVDGSTVSVEFTCWRGLAERVAELNKGDSVLVEGSDDLRIHTYGNFSTLRATARNVSVSMRWHPAASIRTPRPATPIEHESPVTGGYATATDPAPQDEPTPTPAPRARKAAAARPSPESVPA
jgi:single-strand DNA-binding protein